MAMHPELEDRARIRGTTVLALRRGGETVLTADGQVTQGSVILKAGAKKVRRLHNDKILAGFAGATADAIALFERLESRLQASGGNLLKSSVDLAKEWRTDRALRRLEAMLVVADRERILLLSGTGDVVEPDEPVLAIGSGGPFALAAARALLQHTELSGTEIAESAMDIAASICIYTNRQRVLETLEPQED
jgi:ATP-dependent HslUV protease, peptidase subunit HslV